MIIPAFTRKQLVVFWVGVILLIVAASFAVFGFVSPAPPRSLVMSTGAADGAYHQFALKYKEQLAANGVTLELKPSGGSVENLQRLDAGLADVALVQGGLGFLSLDSSNTPDATPLRSLAAVAYEPVWIFSKQLDLNPGLTPLSGKRVAVGIEGSGNRKVALELLATYGVLDKANKPTDPKTDLQALGGIAAAEALMKGDTDAVIMIASPLAPAVQTLLHADGVKVASLDHVDGLARRYPYFQPITLMHGSVDPAKNLPPADVQLLATTANLVIHDNLHPALAYLLLEAANHVHAAPGLLNRPNSFPKGTGVDFPLSDEAERFFKGDRPFLQRYLPFWAANFVQRLIILLVPLIAILVPIFRIVPPLLSWRVKSRLYRRYGELKFLENDLARGELTPEKVVEAKAHLDAIEHDLMDAKFPVDFSDRVYTLRQHLDYVRSQLEPLSAETHS